jgi:multidrug efflux pump subunit AcrA (membrane-fusion protein)
VKRVCLFIGAAAVSAACTSAPRAATEARTVAPVPSVLVGSSDIASRFEAGGIVRARATAFVASRIMATIVQIHARPGDRVRRGQVLVTLDARDMDTGKAQASAAALAADEAARAAEADVRAAESAAQLARATFDRINVLHAKRSATPQELDQATAALAAADAQRGGAQARHASAVAARDAAHAAARSAEIATTYASLAAPVDGIVTERRADPGSMAAPGVPLLTVEDASAYRLEVQVDEARAFTIATGQAVDVLLDSGPANEGMDARVVEIARVDPASHAFVVKIDLGGATGLRSGLFGRAAFAGPSRRALTIPSSALIKRGQLRFVYVIGSDDHPLLRPISIGDIDRDRVEVLAGLREGDSIAMNAGAVR